MRYALASLKASFCLFVMSLLLLSGACGTIRLKYQGEMKNASEDKVVIVEKSYPVKGAFKPLCIISGIFFGGSCWYYLVMPTVAEKKEFKADAYRLIEKRLKVSPDQLSKEKITRVSWQQEATLVVTQPLED